MKIKPTFKSSFATPSPVAASEPSAAAVVSSALESAAGAAVVFCVEPPPHAVYESAITPANAALMIFFPFIIHLLHLMIYDH